MRILVPDVMTPDSLAYMAKSHEVIYEPALGGDLAALLRAAPDAHCMIVRNRIQVRGELLDALGQCRVLGRLGVGLDNIDVAGCKARGIEVIPAIGANALAVAEWVVSAAMMLLRPWYTASAGVAAGHWPRAALLSGREISGKTFGIVGYGSIGRVTAKLAGALGMKIVACGSGSGLHSRTGEQALSTLDEVLAQSDVISLHMPLTDSTRNLIDATALAKMKPGAILVNAARGGIVDEAALAHALRSGHLGGAALDVFEQEPLGAGNVFADVPNLLLSPHVAGVTQEAETRVCELIARRVVEALG
jgi:(S)-sulfolactate dehydrogenase